MHADEARNGTNLARFYGMVLAVRSVATQVEKMVFEHGSYSEVLRLASLQWRLGYLIRDLEEIRATGDRISATMHRSNCDQWANIEKEFGEEEAGFKYIEPPGRSAEQII